MRALLLLLILPVIVINGVKGQPAFDRAAFYKAMASDNKEAINAQLSLLQKSGITEKAAYEGALLMKKASVISRPFEKLNLFKSGHGKLEAAIAADRDNVEYRFLRLMIQEHAPKFLKYNDNLAEDAKMVQEKFDGLAAYLQQEITRYSKSSDHLKPPSHN